MKIWAEFVMDAYLCLLGCAELGKRIEKLPSESKKKEKKIQLFKRIFEAF
jgi:hypothetical protein